MKKITINQQGVEDISSLPTTDQTALVHRLAILVDDITEDSEINAVIFTSSFKNVDKDKVDAKFPGLITYDDRYIVFDDPEVARILINSAGNVDGDNRISVEEMRDMRFHISEPKFGDRLATLFYGSDIESFDEFRYCTNATVVMGYNQSAPNACFGNCKKLKRITLPDSILCIGRNAFNNCTALEEITIPASLITVGNEVDRYSPVFYKSTFGNNAFQNCTSIKKINYKGTIADWAQIDWGTANTNLLNQSGNAELYCNGVKPTAISLVGKTSVKRRAFYNFKQFTSLDMGNAITSVGDSAFYGCSNLVGEIVLPSNATVGSAAFQNCSKLTGEITLNTAPGSSAFRGSGITKYTFGASATGTIGSTLLWECPELEEVVVNAPLTISNSGGGIATSFLRSCAKLKVIRFNEGGSLVNAPIVGDAGMPSVTDLYIPASWTNLANSFWGYANTDRLTNANLKIHITSIADWCAKTIAFAKSSACYYAVGENVISDLVIPSGVTTINNYCWAAGKFNSITIPSTVKSLGNRCFSNVHLAIDLSFTKNLETLGGNAFYGNELAYGTYYIPEGIVTMADYEWSSMTALQAMIIPSSVTALGRGYISNNKGLRYILFKGTTPPTANTAVGWGGYSLSLTAILVPNAQVDSYKAATGWSGVASKVTGFWESSTVPTGAGTTDYCLVGGKDIYHYANSAWTKVA